MSKIICFLAFILWLIITLILVLLGYDDDKWFGIAQDLVKGIKGGEQ